MNFTNLDERNSHINNEFITDVRIFVRIKDCKTDRLILKQANFINKTKSEVFEDINKVSDFFEVENDNLKLIYFTFTGDWSRIVAYLNNKEIKFSDFWSKIEDEIILSNDLLAIDEIIDRRGLKETMLRRLFLKLMQ